MHHSLMKEKYHEARLLLESMHPTRSQHREKFKYKMHKPRDLGV